MSKQIKIEYLEKLFSDYPSLSHLSSDIHKAVDFLIECFYNSGTIYTCGNGGSAADADHIVGELMKGFRLKRQLTSAQANEIVRLYPDEGHEIVKNLQQAIPAISLVSGISLPTAFSNDINSDYVFAQQIYGLGKKNDNLIAISTSGNSINVINAAKIAKVKGIKVISMTGKTGGRLVDFSDVVIKAPASDVAKIQEYHLPIYHCICSLIEHNLFDSQDKRE